VIRRISSLTA